MSNAIRMICPRLACRAVLAVPTTTRGKTVRCSQCGCRVAVPGKPTTSATAGSGNASKA